MVDPSCKDKLDLVVRQQASVASFPSFVVVARPGQVVGPCKVPVVAAWYIVVAYHIVGTSAVGLDTWHSADSPAQGSQLGLVGSLVVIGPGCSLDIVLRQGLVGAFVAVVTLFGLKMILLF